MPDRGTYGAARQEVRVARELEGLSLGEIELFCKVAEQGGFSAAARATGLTTAALSRAVMRLERRLGTRLFVRTTRHVSLTPEGQRYLAHCQAALAQLVAAERELSSERTSARGLVRLSLPTSYGHHRVLPVLPALCQRHPELELDVQLSNRNVALGEGAFDLAVRGRTPPDSELVARKLEDAPLVVVAAPSYLARRGVPHEPAALFAHECVQFVLPSSGADVPWLFWDGGVVRALPTRGALRCHDDVLGPVTLARAGAGLVQTYRFLVADDLARGSLVEVLASYAGASRPFSLLYAKDRHLPQRVRVVVDFLVAHFASPRAPA